MRKLKQSHFVEEVISSTRAEVDLFDYKQTKEFIDFYGKNTWHYMREDLYLAKNKDYQLQ